MTPQKTNLVKSDWRDYVLSPSGAVLQPIRSAQVPADAGNIAGARIKWTDCAPGIPMEVPADSSMALLLDFGKKVAGHLILRTQETEEFALNLISGPVPDLIKIDAALAIKTQCGIWRDPEFRALRYALVTAGDSKAHALSFEFEFTGYPGEYKGWFHCSDDMLNRIWYAGIYTIHLCTQPHEESGCYTHRLPAQYGEFPRAWRSPYGRYVIWDGPRRDREVWIGDMWPECLSLMYSFHAPEVMRTSLHAVACRQREDGLISGSGITLQPFAEYACWWMALLDRFHLLTDDNAFVRDMEPHIRRLMVWLRGQLASNNGFLHIDHRQTWAWTLRRRGVVTGSQCVAVAALRGGARLLALLGDEDLGTTLQREAEALADRIRTHLWNAEEGCMNDCLEPPDGIRRFSCDSNALAVLLGVITGDQAASALRYLRENLWTPYGTRTLVPPEPEEDWNWAHNHNIWPFVVGLELEARFEHGDFEGAMELARTCWGNMIGHNTEAFWEMVCGETGRFVTHRPVADMQPGWDSWDSYSHGWSAGISYMLQAFLLGVRPVEPGFRRFLVKPNLCGLESAEGSIPTPHGPIHIHVTQSGAELALTVPPDTVAEVRHNGKEITLTAGKYTFDSTT